MRVYSKWWVGASGTHYYAIFKHNEICVMSDYSIKRSPFTEATKWYIYTGFMASKEFRSFFDETILYDTAEEAKKAVGKIIPKIKKLMAFV